MVAVSSPRSSFVTDGGLSTAAPPILVVKRDAIRKNPAAALPWLARLGGSLTGKIGQSKLAQGASKLYGDTMAAWGAGVGGAGAGGVSSATASSVPKTHPGIPEVPTHHMGSELSSPPWESQPEAFQRLAGRVPSSNLADRAAAADRGEAAREAGKEGAMGVIKPATALGVGYAGMSALGNRKQRIEQNRVSEQDRIQQVAEQARSKAGTGGGQVGVSA